MIDKEQNDNRSIKDSLGQPLDYAWTDIISAMDEKSENNHPQTETKQKTIDTK